MTSTYKFLQGGGQMGNLLRNFDFSTTTLGTPDTWPDSLRSALSISLNSGFPIAIYWGEDFSLLYNDAWMPIAGDKHPWCIGKPGAIVWAEIWDGLKAQFEGVLSGGDSVRAPDTLLLMNRYGYTEECYFDYTLSPITAMDGTIGGVFNAVIETTQKFIGQRREKLIQSLLQQLNTTHSLDEGISTGISIIETSREDIPFAMLFTTLTDKADGVYFNAQTGIAPAEADERKWLALTGENKAEATHITDLSAHLTSPVLSHWGEICTEALIAPISTGNARINGYMVLGVSPRKRLDDDYRSFLKSVAVHVGSILNNGYAHAQEQKSIRRIFESENRFRDLIQQSPVAIAVVQSDDFIIESVNTEMLKIWGKDNSVLNTPYFSILPEMEDQEYKNILLNVYQSGKSYHGYEAPATINHNGVPTTGYFNFIYHPIKNEDDQVTSVMMVASEVTELVLAKQSEQSMTEELRATNEELKQSRDELMELNQTLVYSESWLAGILNQLPIPIAILNGPDHVVTVANEAILKHWNRTEKDALNKPLIEALPELKDQPFPAFYKKVFDTGKKIENKGVAINLKNAAGEVATKYVNSYYQPISDIYGTRTGIIATVVDITEQVEARQQIEKAQAEEQKLNEELYAINEEMTSTNEELVVSNEELAQSQQELRVTLQELEHSTLRLKNMIATTPIGITVLRGRDLIIEAANAPMLAIWNRTLKQVEGKRLVEAFTDLDGQPFVKLLTDVFDTGVKFAVSEIEADIAGVDGSPKHIYITLSYDPLFDANGNVEAILATVNDITDIVEARKQVEISRANEQALNEELSAINEEMVSANEELLTTNEELAEAQADLNKTLTNLAANEAQLRYMLSEAPIAIAVMMGSDMVIESANKKVLEAWGKTDAVIGKKLKDAVPELIGQNFLELLENVYQTGQPYYGNEVMALLEHDGIIEEVYSNFVYHPVKDIRNNTIGIMLVASVVTEQVQARKKVERAEEMLRFSIEAANVGTWFIDTTTNEMIASARMKELYGFNSDDVITYNDLVAVVADNYRDKVGANLTNTMLQGGNYTSEHPVTGRRDGKRRWVRSIGKLYPDKDGNFTQFSGLALDITEQKEDEIRKNDFIGMVSHELKTPLTSLSAIVQMVEGKARKADDIFAANALGKAHTQVKRMTGMINGFLNISRLESGKLVISKRYFRLDELLRENVEENRLTSPSHTFTFNCNEAINVDADQDKIGSVISNLLSNAVKYSPKGKNISVTCRKEADMVLVSVKDEGMGIKPADIEKLFERYYRVENNNTQHISGFGIGLYLSAEIIKGHNGKIWAESEPELGSTFHFTLPV